MPASSDVPGARALLHEVKRLLKRHPTPLDLQVGLSKIDEALEKMRRATPVTHARVSSNEMNPTLAASIEERHRLYPGESQEEIARRFGVKGGRVSEVLHGQWRKGGKKYEAWMKRHGGFPADG